MKYLLNKWGTIKYGDKTVRAWKVPCLPGQSRRQDHGRSGLCTAQLTTNIGGYLYHLAVTSLSDLDISTCHRNRRQGGLDQYQQQACKNNRTSHMTIVRLLVQLLIGCRKLSQRQ